MHSSGNARTTKIARLQKNVINQTDIIWQKMDCSIDCFSQSSLVSAYTFYILAIFDLFLSSFIYFYRLLQYQFANFSDNLECFDTDRGINFYRFIPMRLSIVKRSDCKALI